MADSAADHGLRWAATGPFTWVLQSLEDGGIVASVGFDSRDDTWSGWARLDGAGTAMPNWLAPSLYGTQLELDWAHGRACLHEAQEQALQVHLNLVQADAERRLGSGGNRWGSDVHLSEVQALWRWHK